LAVRKGGGRRGRFLRRKTTGKSHDGPLFVLSLSPSETETKTRH